MAHCQTFGQCQCSFYMLIVLVTAHILPQPSKGRSTRETGNEWCLVLCVMGDWEKTWFRNLILTIFGYWILKLIWFTNYNWLALNDLITLSWDIAKVRFQNCALFYKFDPPWWDMKKNILCKEHLFFDLLCTWDHRIKWKRNKVMTKKGGMRHPIAWNLTGIFLFEFLYSFCK